MLKSHPCDERKEGFVPRVRELRPSDGGHFGCEAAPECRPALCLGHKGRRRAEANRSGDSASLLHIQGTNVVPTTANSGIQVIQSSSALAVNLGGSLIFGGRSSDTGPTYSNWAGIAGMKANAIDGNTSGYLAFYSRANGENISERMVYADMLVMQ